MMFIVVTQDQFFFMGIKNLLPNSVLVDSWSEIQGNMYFTCKRPLFIIDNRVPLKNIYKIIEHVFSIRKKINVVIFEMNKGVLYKKLAMIFDKYISASDIHKSGRLNKLIKTNVVHFNAGLFFEVFYLSIKEHEVIRLGMTCFNLSEQAKLLGLKKNFIHTKKYYTKTSGF